MLNYTIITSELYAGKTSTSHTKVTSIHYQQLPKKDTNWRIGTNNMSAC